MVFDKTLNVFDIRALILEFKNQTFRGYCLFLSGQDATENVAHVIGFKTNQKTTKLFA